MMKVNDTDKSTWQTVRFGTMVHHISERVQPDDVTVDRYVGLEHLDPESLKIRRWGTPDEVGATKLRFYPGDIIFGKRRFYQRKLAVADFDGICSAHAMVLRAKPDVVLPEFLPFFMQSETFFERAMSISVGSLSPTINWSTLQRQEFALPPLDEQRRIAKVLTAVEDCLIKYENVILRLGQSQRIIFGNHAKRDWEMRKLADLSSHKPQYGINAPAIEYKPQFPRFVRITDISDDGILSHNELVSVDSNDKEFSDYVLKRDDFLFARTGNTVGKTYLYRPKDGYCVFAGYLIRFKLNRDLILPEYLFHFTKSERYKLWIKSTVRVGAQPNINATEYSRLRIPLPPIDEQEKVIVLLNNVDQQIENYNEHLSKTSQLKKSILNTLSVPWIL